MRRPRLTVRSIAQAVSQYYAIGWNDIASARRTVDVVRARQILMFLCREHTTLSLPQIGRRVGGRDHTTVLHSCRKIEHLRDTDAELAQELAEIEGILGDTRTPSPAEAAPDRPALPVIPPPRGAEAVRMVEEVRTAWRNLESARFSARERAERAAFERALNTLSSHFKTETNHAGH